MISCQNTILPHLGADIRQRDLSGRVEVPSLTSDRTGPVMKPTCAPDDGSNAGPWLTVPATEIDGDHPLTRIPAIKETENA